MKHAYYTECPDCGAHLDPNEHCDCLNMRESSDLFALRIEGNYEFILTGDYAIVDPNAEINNGDVVVIEKNGVNIIARLRLIKSEVLESFFVLYPLKGAPIQCDGAVNIVGKVNSIVFSAGERESA